MFAKSFMWVCLLLSLLAGAMLTPAAATSQVEITCCLVEFDEDPGSPQGLSFGPDTSDHLQDSPQLALNEDAFGPAATRAGSAWSVPRATLHAQIRLSLPHKPPRLPS